MANYEGTDLFVKPCNMIRENRGEKIMLLS